MVQVRICHSFWHILLAPFDRHRGEATESQKLSSEESFGAGRGVGVSDIHPGQLLTTESSVPGTPCWAMLMSFICRCKVSGHLRLSARGTYFPCDGDSIIPYAPPASKLEPSPSNHMVWVSISNLSVKFVKYPCLSDHFALDNFSKISLNISSFFGHSSICLFPILLVCLWEIDPVSF